MTKQQVVNSNDMTVWFQANKGKADPTTMAKFFHANKTKTWKDGFWRTTAPNFKS